MALGPEILVNTFFASDANWTLSGSWSISGGTLNKSTATAGSRAIQAISVPAGTYRASFEVKAISGAQVALQIRSGGSVEPTPATYVTTTGVHSVDIVAAGAVTEFHVFTLFGGTATVDNVSLKEVLPGGEIEGATSAGFTTTGTLVGLVLAAGSVAAAFTATGTLEHVPPSGEIAGSTSAAFATTGTLSAEAEMSGTTSASFSTSGAIGSLSQIFGSADLAFAGTGTLIGTSALSGESRMVFTLAVNMGIPPVIARTAERSNNWLPNATVPFLTKQGLVSPVWYRWFKEIAENRLGGVSAPTVGEVVASQEAAQVELAETKTIAQSASAVAVNSAQAVNVIKQVAEDNGLSGSAGIPTQPV